MPLALFASAPMTLVTAVPCRRSDVLPAWAKILVFEIDSAVDDGNAHPPTLGVPMGTVQIQRIEAMLQVRVSIVVLLNLRRACLELIERLCRLDTQILA